MKIEFSKEDIVETLQQFNKGIGSAEDTLDELNKIVFYGRTRKEIIDEENKQLFGGSKN